MQEEGEKIERDYEFTFYSKKMSINLPFIGCISIQHVSFDWDLFAVIIYFADDTIFEYD